MLLFQNLHSSYIYANSFVLKSSVIFFYVAKFGKIYCLIKNEFFLLEIIKS